MSYLFTHEDQAERERLAAIEAGLDPFTIECLERIGVREGWQCLEVGAGAGSIAEWLCRRVGPSGKVVATDLQTKFLEAIDAPNLIVRKHDVTKEDFEPQAFDLVLARKVLEHLPDPSAALRRMAAALRPGGWLLVEDTDLASFIRVSFPHRERFERAYRKFLEALDSAGFQANLGVRLGDELRAVGLRDVSLKGFLIEATGGSDHPGNKVYRMTVQRMRERMVKAGLLTNEEIDQFLCDLQSPELHAMTAIHCSASARKT
ncbi:MAG: methyltransferase domain-containing protein [Planctomycetes bacterium]|nr:methyltransferase domain-containing protein [Planctomycetota bacterium]